MSDPRSERLRTLFARAHELPATARAVFLEHHCGGDAELKQRLAAMLAVADGELGAHATAELPAPAEAAPLREGPGTRIGPYKLLQLIGEGGFGVVFLAEQEKPVARKVALKILKLGMDTRQVVARFEQERQALALMDHPNIARVLDAGATETGRPYFVMDLVKGNPIVEYCDKNLLTIAERLQLFAQVCHAVQHAHGKGVIHRDLKPTNVLVGTQDGKPQAKVIDFGIAKATSNKLTEKTLFTEHQQVVGTLQYMSPEQAEGSLDLDTRTDIYSLGVLLYELLTGSTPFDKKTIKGAMYGELQRMIREIEPPKPSTRVSDSRDILATIAAQRRIEPKRLGTLIRGELDWIVMKTLDKDRARRYETASALAADVDRYLKGEAVVAAPPSVVYRVRKFARRNRGTVAALAAIAAALLIGVIGFAWQADIARSERDLAVQAKEAETNERTRAEGLRASEARQRAIAESNERKAAAINQFLLDMLGSADLRAFGHEAKVAQALDKAAVSVGTAFTDRPEVEAAVRQVLGKTYASLGMLDQAQPQIEAALELNRKTHGEESTEFATCLKIFGAYLMDRGEAESAAEALRQAVDITNRVVGPETQSTLAVQTDYANALMQLRQDKEAERILRQTLAVQERVFGRATPDGQIQINTLAVLLHRQGQLDEAEALYREALTIGTQVLGSEHADTFTASMNLASMLRSRGKDSEAEPLLRSAYTGIKRVFGESHPHTATAAQLLATFCMDTGRYAEALPLAEESLALRIAHQGEQTADVGRAQVLLGRLLQFMGNYRRAAECVAKGVAILSAVFGAESEATLAARFELAKNLMSASRTEEAQAIFRELLEVCPRVLAASHWLNVYTPNSYALLLASQERFAEAEPYAKSALEAGRLAQGEDNMNTLATQCNLANIQRGLGRLEMAETLARDAVERCVRVLGPNHASTAATHATHGSMLAALGRSDEAEREFLAAIDVAKATLGKDNPGYCRAALSLGMLRLDQGRDRDAEPVLREAAEDCEQARGLEDRLTAALRRELGLCLAVQGNFEEGESLLVSSHAVLARSLRPGHSELQRAERHLARLYRDWNLAAPDADRAAKVLEWEAKANAPR